MKILILAATLMLSALSVGADAKDHKTAHAHHYTEIQTHDLKSWYDQGIDMLVLDARSEKYFSGILLPNATWLPYNASEEDVRATIPSKDSLIIVYCLSSDCPMAKWMAKRLTSEGYTNVYKYTAGLKEWIDSGYPTEQ